MVCNEFTMYCKCAYLSDVGLETFDTVSSDDKPEFQGSETFTQPNLPVLSNQ